MLVLTDRRALELIRFNFLCEKKLRPLVEGMYSMKAAELVNTVSRFCASIKLNR